MSGFTIDTSLPICYVRMWMHAWRRHENCFNSLLGAMAFSVLVAGTLPTHSAEPPGKGSFEVLLERLGYELVQMERDSSHALEVRGTVNGREELFCVDTGCTFTTVKPSVGKRLKSLGELGAKLEDSFWGKLEDPSIAIIETLGLGRGRFLNQPARVREIDYATQRFKGAGFLGCDFLHRNNSLIDCAYRRLYLRASPPQLELRNVLEESLRRSGFIEIPLRMEFERVMTLEAIANGESVRLLVDTGGMFSMLDNSQKDRLHLNLSANAVEVQGVGRIGRHDLKETTLKTLELPGLTLRNLSFGVADLGAWGLAEQSNGSSHIHGILGAEYLCNYGAIIDCRGLRLWLKQPKREH